MMLTISRATVADVSDADILIREAADWLIKRGMALWGPNEISYEALVHVAEANELVIGRIGSEAVTCMYLHNEDRLFWPNKPNGEAFYIHRLAVARKYAGRGFAHAMLEWAEDEARRTGRRFVRLDCEPRAKLLQLYKAAGYVRIDAAPIQVGEHFVVRHEREV